MNLVDLKSGVIVRGPMLPEPVEIRVVRPLGEVVKLTGAGQRTGQVHISACSTLALLLASPQSEPFDGEPLHFKLGVEAARLGARLRVRPVFLALDRARRGAAKRSSASSSRKASAGSRSSGSSRRRSPRSTRAAPTRSAGSAASSRARKGLGF